MILPFFVASWRLFAFFEGYFLKFHQNSVHCGEKIKISSEIQTIKFYNMALRKSKREKTGKRT